MDAQKELEADVTVTQFSMKSVITVPLMISGKVLGAIYLDNRQVKGLFTEENFELLKAFAIEAAISINVNFINKCKNETGSNKDK